MKYLTFFVVLILFIGCGTKKEVKKTEQSYLLMTSKKGIFEDGQLPEMRLIFNLLLVTTHMFAIAANPRNTKANTGLVHMRNIKDMKVKKQETSKVMDLKAP